MKTWPAKIHIALEVGWIVRRGGEHILGENYCGSVLVIAIRGQLMTLCFDETCSLTLASGSDYDTNILSRMIREFH